MAYTDKVKDILEYVQDNPINIKSERMFYVSTDKLDASRLPDVVESLASEDVLIDRKAEDDQRINRPSITKAQQHLADVEVAMLYLATGGMDEAHNLVLPYSWPEPQLELCGPPIHGSPAIKESEYCHALVHRKEGEILGELGMVGFKNCKFWFGKTGFHPLYEKVKIEAIEKQSKHKVVQEFQESLSKQTWHPDVFTDLCNLALDSKDKELIDYCDQISAKEWSILMQFINAKVNPL